MTDQSAAWWPVATSNELRAGQVLARSLLDLPLVVFRAADGTAAVLEDRCPHRHAPLSAGCVRDGALQCPYHGWRFDAHGRCTKVPGLDAHRVSATALARAVSTAETGGLVWACLNPAVHTQPPSMPAEWQPAQDAFFMTDQVHCGMAEAAENFLDGFHTHFVHSGWIRRDTQRQTVTAEVSPIAGGVQARYSEEGLQSGLISRLLEPGRQESMGRFRMPGVAEIEYRGPRGLTLLVTAWLTPESTNRLRIHARIATRRALLPAWLKALVLRRLFAVILRQDKEILQKTQANTARFSAVEQASGAPALLNSPLDLLGPHIRSMLAGQPLQGLNTSTPVTLHL